MREIVKKIRNNEFWSSVIKLSSGTIIGQAITMLMTLVLSRLYSTESYGDQGIITSTATIITTLVSFGLNSAIMVQKDQKDSAKVLRVSVVIQCIIAIIVFSVLLCISSSFQIFKTSIDYRISLFLCFLYVCIVSLYNAMRMYINKLKMNNVLFVNSIINGVCSVIITLPLAFVDAKCIGLLAGVIAAFLISSFHMILKSNPFGEMIKLDDFKFVLQQCKQFIIYQYPSNVISNSSIQLPNQVLSNVYGNSTLGYYSMVTRLFHLPLNLIATPIQNVYFRTVSADNKSYDKIAGFTYSLLTKMCLIAFLPAVLLMVFGEPIFAFVLGQSWRQSGVFAGILILPLIFQFCRTCIAYCKVSIGRQKTNLILSIANLVIVAAAIFCGVLFNFDVKTTILLYAIGNLLYQFLDIYITFVCLGRNANKWLLFSIAYISATVLISLLMRSLFV